MEEEPAFRRAHLLMLRVWQEDLGEGKTEWRGKLQSVADGESRYFRNWAGLVAALEEMMQQPEKSQALEHQEPG